MSERNTHDTEIRVTLEAAGVIPQAEEQVRNISREDSLKQR